MFGSITKKMGGLISGITKLGGGIKNGIGKVNGFVSRAEGIASTISHVPLVGQVLENQFNKRGGGRLVGLVKDGQGRMNKYGNYIPG